MCVTHATGWRQFDDDKVLTVGESSVVTRAAYLLFYRRRDLVPSKRDKSAATSVPGGVSLDVDDNDSQEPDDDIQSASFLRRDKHPKGTMPRVAYPMTDIDDID